MKTTLFCTLWLCSLTLFSQLCLPDGITLTSAQDISDFTSLNPTCTTIEGDVIIQGITNFLGLEQITTIEGKIICDNCSGFQNFEGLTNLETLGGIEWIDGDDFEFEGLESLNEVTSDITLVGAHVNYFHGLETLGSIGGDFLIENTTLIAVGNLSSLSEIGGSFIIRQNPIFFNIGIMGSLSSVGQSLVIEDNPAFSITASFLGLTEVGNDLKLINNPSLFGLVGFTNVESIGGNLFVEQIPNITDLDEFSNLLTIDGAISILDNESLSDISGIANIDPESISALQIVNCPELSLCAVESVCGFLNISPQFAQIGSNLPNCNTTQEVQDNCAINSISELELEEFTLQTNLVENQLVIVSSLPRAYTILNMLGQVKQQVNSAERAIDVSGLSAGTYIIKTESGDQTIKFQKL